MALIPWRSWQVRAVFYLLILGGFAGAFYHYYGPDAAPVESSWQKAQRRQTSELPPVTKAMVFVLDESEKSKTDDMFPIRPYGQSVPVVKKIILNRADSESLAKLWRQLHYSGAGALCHYPVYGIRFYDGDRMILETSLCWECGNCYLEDGNGGYTWQGFFDFDFQLLKSLRRLLPPTKDQEAAISVKIGSAAFFTYKEALSELDHAIDLDENNVEAHLWRAKYRELGGQPELAIADINAALPTAPEWRQIGLLELRGNCHAKAGNHKAAVEDFNAAVELAKKRDEMPRRELFLSRAASYEKLGNVDAAAKDRELAKH